MHQLPDEYPRLLRLEDFPQKHQENKLCVHASHQIKSFWRLVKNNGTELGTAFTTSIEAAEGVTTGISAADRATTIQVAVNKNARVNDIVQPGHVFPIETLLAGR